MIETLKDCTRPSRPTRCWFIGPVRIRWAGDDFRPLYSERYGHRRWLRVGRLGLRLDRKTR